MNKELMKGTTDIIILNLLNREPMYGYGLIKSLTLMSKGLFELKEGTLYPILHGLEAKGYIVSFGNKRRMNAVENTTKSQMTASLFWVKDSKNGICSAVQ